jgi:hypothetical protein
MIESLKEYIALNEMAYIDPALNPSVVRPNKRKELERDWIPSKRTIKQSGAEKVGDTDTHHVYRMENQHETTYAAVDKQTGEVHAAVNGNHDDYGYHIDSMSKKSGEKIKMHDFLHHLIHNHVGTVHSDQFSSGGKRVFDSLSRMPNIEAKEVRNGEEGPYGDHAYTDGKHDKHWSRVSMGLHDLDTSEFHREKLNEEANPEYDDAHARFLSPEHTKAVRAYCRGSTAINNLCHINAGNKGLSGTTAPGYKDPGTQKKIDALDAVFSDNKNHVGRRLHVMTGLAKDPAQLFRKEDKRAGERVKKVRVRKVRFLSTTDDPEVAKKFAETRVVRGKTVRHVLHLHVPAEHPTVSAVSSSPENFKDEREFILHRNTTIDIDREKQIEKHEDGSETHNWFGRVVRRPE